MLLDLNQISREMRENRKKIEELIKSCPNPKVLVIVITKDYIIPECYESILNQDYSNYSILIHIQKPEKLHKENYINKDLNIVNNRNVARKAALSLNSDYFFFVDSDILLPRNAIKDLIEFRPNISGGYYKVFGDDRYACGKWIDDNVIAPYRNIENQNVAADFLGVGCLMVKREVLEKISFQSGTGNGEFLYCSDEKGEKLMLCESAMFGNRAKELGYIMELRNKVTCGHLDSKKSLAKISKIDNTINMTNENIGQNPGQSQAEPTPQEALKLLQSAAQQLALKYNDHVTLEKCVAILNKAISPNNLTVIE